ncbi:hypothetical protein [Streptomyces kaniharaensis]|uniref:hypothetical protein n=1 Tax=Streptomyces kaniharaensis TaxID=212423 RepID=UPI0018A80F16|nr:hypothetical protein [Streptomyces kaniharaensis]
MAGGTGFTVNPRELTAAGTNAVAVAGKVPDETAKLGDPTDKAAASLTGWKSGTALQRCGTAWKTLLDELAGTMKDAGGHLVTCAHTYVNADHLPAPVATDAPDPFDTRIVGFNARIVGGSPIDHA